MSKRARVLSPMKARNAEQFAAGLRQVFGHRLEAVLQYDWIIEEIEDDDEADHALELVAVIQGYKDDREESDKVFDVTERIDEENEYDVMLFPTVYDRAHFATYGGEPPWEEARIVREGNVIYDGGLIAKLREQQSTVGR